MLFFPFIRTGMSNKNPSVVEGFFVSVNPIAIGSAYSILIRDQKSTPIAKYQLGFPLNIPFISQAASALIK